MQMKCSNYVCPSRAGRYERRRRNGRRVEVLHYKLKNLKPSLTSSSNHPSSGKGSFLFLLLLLFFFFFFAVDGIKSCCADFNVLQLRLNEDFVVSREKVPCRINTVEDRGNKKKTNVYFKDQDLEYILLRHMSHGKNDL